MTSSLTVAVHGATGIQGAPVVRRLRADGHRVRGLSRSGEYAVDLADARSLECAYAGVDAVVLQLPLVFDETALRQADAAAAAVVRSGVPRVVFNTSGPRPPV